MPTLLRWAILLQLAGTTPAAAAAQGRRLAPLTPCSVAGLESTALCGGFETRERPDDPTSRPLRLHVVVLPATTDSVLADPLAFLAGGGVVPASRYAGFLARAFPELRRHRDILLVDQRGTWNSNPLTCEPQQPAAACAASLAVRADLTTYSTEAAVRDLDAVRAWLGYRTLNLYGTSYGTRVAQVYLKRYPDRVRAAVLYGVVPLSIPFQLELAHSSQQSLERVFDLCARDPACNSSYPRLRAEFDSVLGKLSRSPRPLPPDTVAQFGIPAVTDRMVRNVVQGMLGTMRGIERIPLLVHQSHGGDYSAVLRNVLGDGAPPPPPAPRGVFLSLLCNETLNQVKETDIEPATRGSFFGSAPVRSQLAQCSGWPRVETPNEFFAPVRAPHPVLAMSGDLDPITPPRYADVVAAFLPGARHLVVPNRSHGDVDSCITGIFQEFLMRGNAEALDTSCVSVPHPLRFALQ